MSQDNRINDFIALFNAFWYRDFPLTKDYKDFGERAEWTIHIGVCVRSCADLLGLFTYFEAGGRTDAIIKDNQQNEIAHIEWEWWEPASGKVNEIKKLSNSHENAEFSVLISYSQIKDLDKNIKSIELQWEQVSKPLVVILITFERENNKRLFYELKTYIVKNGKAKNVRTQPALPWDVGGTRWELALKPVE